MAGARCAPRVALLLVVGCGKPAEPAAQAVRARATSAAVVVEALPAGFTSATAEASGTTLHYVVGGQGPALILIHGFPDNWSAFATIMPDVVGHDIGGGIAYAIARLHPDQFAAR